MSGPTFTFENAFSNKYANNKSFGINSVEERLLGYPAKVLKRSYFLNTQNTNTGRRRRFESSRFKPLCRLAFYLGDNLAKDGLMS